MATSMEGSFLPGFTASSDLSAAANLYKLVKMASTAGKVILAAAATDIPLGVLYNKPAAGEAALIALGPVVKAQAEASVSAGTYLCSNSTGQVQATTNANDDVIGIALEASTNAADIIRVLVRGFNY